MKVFEGSAGSGKTTRLIEFVKEKLARIPEERAVIVTFTRAAAKEFKQRAGLQNAFIGTLHSWALNFLRNWSHRIRLASNFTVEEAGRLSKLGVANPDAILTFDDLIHRTCEALKQNEEIRRATQDSIGLLVCDEFQDFTQEQAELIRLLIRGGQEIAIAFDERQSIFGWTDALGMRTRAWLQSLGNVEFESLEKIYRFSEARAKEVENAKAGAYPLCQVFLTKKEEAAFLKESLTSLIQRGTKPTDCAVLTRTRHRAIELANACGGNFPIICSPKIHSLFDDSSIKGFLGVLKLALNKWDVVAACDAGASFGVAPASVQFLAIDKGLDYREAFLQACGITNEQRQKFSLIRANEIENALSIAGDLITAGLMKTSDREIRSLLAFRNLLCDLLQKDDELRNGNLMSLLDYLVSPDFEFREEEAVTFSTIHKAKGREWKYVFIAGCEEFLPKHEPAQEDEERRLLFVSFSRAKEVCVLTCAIERKKPPYFIRVNEKLCRE